MVKSPGRSGLALRWDVDLQQLMCTLRGMVTHVRGALASKLSEALSRFLTSRLWRSDGTRRIELMRMSMLNRFDLFYTLQETMLPEIQPQDIDRVLHGSEDLMQMTQYPTRKDHFQFSMGRSAWRSPEHVHDVLLLKESYRACCSLCKPQAEMMMLCSYEPMDDIVRGMPFPDNFDDLAVMQSFVPLGTSTPDIARSVSLTSRDLPSSPYLQDSNAAGLRCMRHASLLRCHHMQMCAGQYC